MFRDYGRSGRRFEGRLAGRSYLPKTAQKVSRDEPVNDRGPVNMINFNLLLFFKTYKDSGGWFIPDECYIRLFEDHHLSLIFHQ